MQSLYTTYISKHPSSHAHLTALTNNDKLTPALKSYLQLTRALTSAHTHSWDLPSLLIKPVQRLLKYPLLLTTIIEGTPDGHPDKKNLFLAREKLEEAARNVNEKKRRWEAVKGVLDGGGASGIFKNKLMQSAGDHAPRVNEPGGLSRMATIRTKLKTSLSGGHPGGINSDAGLSELQCWELRLKECEKVLRDLMRAAHDWSRYTELTLERLRAWGVKFGNTVESGEKIVTFDEVLAGIQELRGQKVRVLITHFIFFCR